MFATTATASDKQSRTAHHPNARRLNSSRLTSEISANNASLRCETPTCSSTAAAIAAGT